MCTFGKKRWYRQLTLACTYHSHYVIPCVYTPVSTLYSIPLHTVSICLHLTHIHTHTHTHTLNLDTHLHTHTHTHTHTLYNTHTHTHTHTHNVKHDVSSARLSYVRTTDSIACGRQQAGSLHPQVLAIGRHVNCWLHTGSTYLPVCLHSMIINLICQLRSGWPSWPIKIPRPISVHKQIA